MDLPTQGFYLRFVASVRYYFVLRFADFNRQAL